MRQLTRFVGLDVHAETIAVAMAESDGEVRDLGTVPNRPDAVRKLVKKLGGREGLRVCYEAGPCGYVLYWQLVELDVHCDVVAPTLVPVKPGVRVKTDRRDARKLARSYRSGDLTPVWVPDGAYEALRDLVRAREAAKRDQLRARHRVQKFLLRRGRHRPQGMQPWTNRHQVWLYTQSFEHVAQQSTYLDYVHEVDHARERIERLEKAIDQALPSLPATMRQVVEGLQALRGVSQLSAVTIVAEVGWLSRFAHPRQLMGYSGAVPSEWSSGGKTSRGKITKSGNAHLRRIIIEAAWAYRHRPTLGPTLRKRQAGLDPALKEIGWKAQHRLCSRYRRLAAKGKPNQHIVTAVGRELLGFIWAIGTRVEQSTVKQHIA